MKNLKLGAVKIAFEAYLFISEIKDVDRLHEMLICLLGMIEQCPNATAAECLQALKDEHNKTNS